MATEEQREKLLQAIVFFVKETRRCQKLKLFKLLFFFDFDVFRQTGKSATGLEYFAWPMGPVPNALFEELKKPLPDLAGRVLVREARVDDPDFKEMGLQLTAKKPFDESKFTLRELGILKRLAEIYLDASATDMREASHLRGQPWHQVYEVERRKQAPIPYELALDGTEGSITKEQAKLIAEEQREAQGIFG